MVTSVIKPTLKYDEDQIIMEEDHGIDVDIYELEVFHRVIQVVIGKDNKKYVHRGILTYSIYAIVKNRIKSRLGVIEVPVKSFSVFDVKNKTPDFTLYEPLLFSFVNSLFVDKLNPDMVTDEDGDADDDTFDEPVVKGDVKNGLENSVGKGGDEIFTRVAFRAHTLQEESETVAKMIRKKYVEELDNNWVQQFMKNPNYDIEYNSGRGDCFFYVIIQAFNQIGMETTISKLRNL
jgi:hypothetical protein